VRTAALQVARQTVLGRRPTPFASLDILASLRDGELGTYVHEDLVEALGKDLTHHALAKLHMQVFAEWLNTPLKEQTPAVGEHIRNGTAGRAPIIDVSASSFRHLAPESAERPERVLFEGDLTMVLALLAAEETDALAGGAEGLWRIAFAMDEVKLSAGRAGLTVTHLAEILGVSPNHLGRVFHEKSGVTFRRYLLAARMVRAANLLRSSAVTLKHVAGMVGYTDQPNFCRDFRKAFGRSVNGYRLQAVRPR
jgi:AraC-like DNA-binding protein